MNRSVRRIALALSLTIAFPLAADRIIPSVARTEGRNGAFFLTDARFLNTSTTDTVTVAVTFYPVGGNSVTAQELTIGPREQVAYDNIVESLFGITSNVTGLVRVAASDALEVSTCTYNRNDPCTAGTLGSWIPGLLERDAITSGIIPQAAGSSDPLTGYRTNDSAVFVARASEAPIADTLVRVGDKASFSGAYGVSGEAEIVSPTTVRLTNFKASGTAPGMDVRFDKSGTSRRDFAVARVLGRQSFNGSTLDIALPAGIGLDSFDTVTIWCLEFDVIIAEGKFSR